MIVDLCFEGTGHRFCLHASQVLQRALTLGQPRDKSNLRAYTDSFDARSLFRRGIRYTTKSCMRSFMYDGECSREMTSLEQAPRVQDANANIGEIMRTARTRHDDDTVAQITLDALQSNRVKAIDYPYCLLEAGLGSFELLAVEHRQKEDQTRDVTSCASHSIDPEHSALYQSTSS